MIQANELRIGDIVLRAKLLQKAYTLPNEWEYDQITVSHNDITACVLKPESFKPIPLTPEILEKCGFVYDDVFEKWFIYLNKHELDIDRLTFRKYEGFICFDGIDKRTILKQVKYLHQLQNLYFALTGEELEYNSQNANCK
jgi:hypothetical protein